MSISVVFFGKNLITQGYCFWESLHSCLPFADELIISEGYSDDNTYEYLNKFISEYKNQLPITMFQDKWEVNSYHGEVIAKVSNRLIKKATKDWVYYLQADEIIHEDNIEYIKTISELSNYNSVSFPFYHFTRAWHPTPGYTDAIRMIRNHRDINLKGDAWTFEGEIDPVCPSSKSPKPIYHFGYVFPKQSDIKDIQHFGLYTNVIQYKERMQKAAVTLKENKKPFPRTDFDDFPELSRKFIGKGEYPLP